MSGELPPVTALQQEFENVPDFLQDVVAAILTYLPRIIAAIVILIIAWIIGKILAGIVERLAQAGDIDRRARDTPLGRMFSGEHGVSNALGTIAAWFVYLLGFVAAADALAIPILSQWLTDALTYLPSLIAGILVIVFGFIVADFIGDAVTRAGRGPLTAWFATGLRVFLYFVVIIIGLDTMQVDVEILYVFARAIAWGLAIALALGGGIALGWGGKDYVSNNIGRWMGRAKEKSPSPGGSSSQSQQ